MKIRKLHLSLIVSAIFLCGTIFGAAGALIYVHHRISAFTEGGPPAVRKLALNRLTVALDIRDDQQQAFSRVISDTHDQFLDLRVKVQPEVAAILDGAVGKLDRFLDEEQKQRLHMIYAKYKERWELKERPVL